MSIHQVLPLTEYIFEASFSTSARRLRNFKSIDQSELGHLRPCIGTLTQVKTYESRRDKYEIFRKELVFWEFSSQEFIS